MFTRLLSLPAQDSSRCLWLYSPSHPQSNPYCQPCLGAIVSSLYTWCTNQACTDIFKFTLILSDLLVVCFWMCLPSPGSDGGRWTERAECCWLLPFTVDFLSCPLPEVIAVTYFYSMPLQKLHHCLGSPAPCFSQAQTSRSVSPGLLVHTVPFPCPRLPLLCSDYTSCWEVSLDSGPDLTGKLNITRIWSWSRISGFISFPILAPTHWPCPTRRN